MPLKLNFKKLTSSKPVYALAVGFSLVILGILFSNIPTMIASLNWPSTGGKVTSRTLLGQKFKEYDGDYYYHIDGYIRYEYSVDNKTYSSTAVNSLRSACYPHETALRYPEGKDVVVYYNPRNPAKSVLEPGWVLSPEALGFFPSLIMIAGLYLIARRAWFQIKNK